MLVYLSPKPPPFDASPQITGLYSPLQQFTSHSYRVTLTYGYDGDGRKLKQTKSSPNLFPQTSSIYYLHSSVLGGQVITELRENGEKRFGYIYMGSQEVAREEVSGGYGSLTWRHENMVSGSVRRTDTSGAVITGESVELDALGNSVGLSDPYPSQAEVDNSDRAYPRFGEPVNQFGGCSVDGVPAPCGYALGLLNNGSAALCPNGDCGAQRVVENGHARIAPPLLYTNQGVGYSRWVPNSNPRPENPEANTPIGAPPAGSDLDGVVKQNGYGQGGHYEWVTEPGGVVFIDGLQRSTPQKPAQLIQAFADAANVLRNDKNCAKLFGATNRRSLNNLLRTLNALGKNARYDENLGTDAATADRGRSARISVGPVFFNDGAIRTNLTYAPTDPRQYRAHTILHELAHALRRIPDDATSFDQQLDNNKAITEKCGQGLNGLQ